MSPRQEGAGYMGVIVADEIYRPTATDAEMSFDIDIDVELNGIVFDMSDENDRYLLEFVLCAMLKQSKKSEAA